MTLVFCTDDNSGVAFNDRRQSRDSKLIDDLYQTFESVLIGEYSAPLFAGRPATLCADPVAQARERDAVFLEKTDTAALLDKADELVIYKWNRRYPADLYFTGDPAACGFSLSEESDFVGSSHEQITRQVWRRG